MVAVAVRAQAKVCTVVASANKAEPASRPAAPRPAAKSVSMASSAAAKTLAATSVAVALASNTMSANAMELLAQTYEAQPVAQVAELTKAEKAAALAAALAEEKGINKEKEVKEFSSPAAFVSKPKPAAKVAEEKKLEMPKSIAVDDKPSLGAAAPFLLLFSPLLLVLADALQKAGRLVVKTISSLGN